MDTNQLNGKVVLMYVKDGQALPIAMTDEEFTFLQTLAPVIFGGEPLKVVNQPVGPVINLVGGKK